MFYYLKARQDIVFVEERAEMFISLDNESKYDYLKLNYPQFNFANIYFYDSGICRSILLFSNNDEHISVVHDFGPRICLNHKSGVLIMMY